MERPSQSLLSPARIMRSISSAIRPRKADGPRHFDLAKPSAPPAPPSTDPIIDLVALLEDDGGWTIVDSGLGNQATRGHTFAERILAMNRAVPGIAPGHYAERFQVACWGC